LFRLVVYQADAKDIVGEVGIYFGLVISQLGVKNNVGKLELVVRICADQNLLGWVAEVAINAERLIVGDGKVVRLSCFDVSIGSKTSDALSLVYDNWLKGVGSAVCCGSEDEVNGDVLLEA